MLICAIVFKARRSINQTNMFIMSGMCTTSIFIAYVANIEGRLRIGNDANPKDYVFL